MDHVEGSELRKKLIDTAIKNGITVFSGYKNENETGIRYFLPIEYCGAGWFAISIEANGNTYPCTFLKDYFHDNGIPVENIHSKSLLNIWRFGEMFKHVRDENNFKVLQGPWCPALKRFDKSNNNS